MTLKMHRSLTFSVHRPHQSPLQGRVCLFAHELQFRAVKAVVTLSPCPRSPAVPPCSRRLNAPDCSSARASDLSGSDGVYFSLRATISQCGSSGGFAANSSTTVKTQTVPPVWPNDRGV